VLIPQDDVDSGVRAIRISPWIVYLYLYLDDYQSLCYVHREILTNSQREQEFLQTKLDVVKN
jgi:hypothetical protein